MNQMKIIPFEERHFSEVVTFAYRIYYPDFWEDNDAFNAKLKLFPEGCLAFKTGNKTVGYVFSHPWKDELDVVSLNETLQSLPDNPDTYYIHDLAIDPDFHGFGIGTQLAIHILKFAENKGFKSVKLVSVLNSEGFWKKFGFEPVSNILYGSHKAAVMKLKF